MTLPILIASVSEEEARTLEEAANVGGTLDVALKWPPAEAVPHLLEVYLPTSNEPLRLLAEPLGGESLRLYPYEEIANDRAPTSDALVGRKLAGGRLELTSPMGAGSIGAVYRGKHSGVGHPVAVKILHEVFQRDIEFCRRFYAEALALSRLSHPNLVHVYDFGQEPDGLLYIAMACVEGETLRALHGRSRRLPIPRIVALMLQVAAGLGHAHSRGLIHRDVKPDNVMLVTAENDDGELVETVKVLDFGFAVDPLVSGEVAQRLAGTPVYMSPEQCRGEELDARTDVYACGVMIYELAVGRVRFLADDPAQIHQLHLHSPVPPLADARLERLVHRALAKRREDRQANMQELRAELKALLLSGPEALLQERIAAAPTAEMRIAFVKGMRAFAADALPVLAPALSTSDADLLEDVLLSLPVVTDEACAVRVVELSHSPIATVCRAAARAIVRLRGPRARTVLEALLGHADEGVRVAALVGLGEIAAVDDVQVARIATLLEDGLVASEKLRAAAVAALSSSTLPAAASLLATLVR